MEIKKFQKRLEDFTCEHCGAEIAGNGYTNHCPQCLWSKHVDINPGDRLASCRGMMCPTAIETAGKRHVIVFVCQQCGFMRNDHVRQNDSFDAVLSVSSRLV